jgi:beta-glucosidase
VQSTGAPAPAPEQAAAQFAAQTPEQMLAAMSFSRMVAQIIMPEIGSITPEGVRKDRFCTILDGGNSGPYGDDKAPAADWLKLADEYGEASTAPLPKGEPVIPVV